MAAPSEFEAFVRELFHRLGVIRTRRMFGGVGVYADDLFFALGADGELYIKADAETDPLFEAEGCPRFTYATSEGAHTMAYRRLPETALDDAEEATRWGRLGVDAALRAKVRAPARAKKARRANG